jgi:hypothetical protein
MTSEFKIPISINYASVSDWCIFRNVIIGIVQFLSVTLRYQEVVNKHGGCSQRISLFCIYFRKIIDFDENKILSLFATATKLSGLIAKMTLTPYPWQRGSSGTKQPIFV